MYTLLIVDDDILAIEGVKSDLNLDKLGISELLTAFSMHQAKELFVSHSIDILLCDIEMPQGSGLELITWVKEKYPDLPAIFLTCHADFRYAKQALQLGCVDYLLKPALPEELEKVILKAEEIIEKDSEMKKASRSHQFYEKNYTLVIENFWLSLINQKTIIDQAVIQEMSEELNILIPLDLKFIPVYINIQRWGKKLSTRKEKISDYTLKELAREIIIGKEKSGQVIQINRGDMLGIIACEHDIDINGLKKNCKNYIAFCNQYFSCDLSCYIGQPVYACEMADAVDKLHLLENNNVFYNKVLLLSESAAGDTKEKIPDMSLWTAMLKNGESDNVITKISEFIDDLIRNEEADATTLRKFHEDFMQMIYILLNQKGIQAHQIFEDSTSKELAAEAMHSVMDMQVWTGYVVTKVMDQIYDSDKANGIVEKVKKYISTHMDEEDMSRETIAKYAFINPDYLSRLFKKETGMSLSDYLLMKRIEKAQELLETTDINISAVLLEVGYSNFSHFSKMFKKVTGYRPVDYRKYKRKMLKT